MKNFIFKSQEDFHKIVFKQLEMLLTEQRKQRSDLSTLMRMSTRLINTARLQKQVDEYFEDNENDIPEEKDDSNNRD